MKMFGASVVCGENFGVHERPLRKWRFFKCSGHRGGYSHSHSAIHNEQQYTQPITPAPHATPPAPVARPPLSTDRSPQSVPGDKWRRAPPAHILPHVTEAAAACDQAAPQGRSTTNITSSRLRTIWYQPRTQGGSRSRALSSATCASAPHTSLSTPIAAVAAAHSWPPPRGHARRRRRRRRSSTLSAINHTLRITSFVLTGCRRVTRPCRLVG